MPVMDGLVTLRELRARGHKMPVIMCSSLTQRGAKVTIEALAAAHRTTWPSLPDNPAARPPCARWARIDSQDPRTHQSSPQLPGPLSSSFALGARGVSAAIRRAAADSTAAASPQSDGRSPSPRPDGLAIGVSTGGPAALDILLPALPANFPLPVLIVQHMPELFTACLPSGSTTAASCVCARPSRANRCAGTSTSPRQLAHGSAPGSRRRSAAPTLHLSQGPLENHCRPAVDVLFRSAAKVYGAGVLAVVLTGMGSDGMLGCRVIREHGGSVWPRTRPSAPSGECRAPSPMRAWRTRFCPSTPSRLRF
jgi:two-component system chemotaxis response regulator CheB